MLGIELRDNILGELSIEMHIDVREARVEWAASGHKSMNGGTTLLYSPVPDLCTQYIPYERLPIRTIMGRGQGSGWWGLKGGVLKQSSA